MNSVVLRRSFSRSLLYEPGPAPPRPVPPTAGRVCRKLLLGGWDEGAGKLSFPFTLVGAEVVSALVCGKC